MALDGKPHQMAARSAGRGGPAPRAPALVVDSRDLLDGRRMLVIRHGAEEYRLHLTQGGKLILTK
jgi:hemin uptake protein HemP